MDKNDEASMPAFCAKALKDKVTEASKDDATMPELSSENSMDASTLPNISAEVVQDEASIPEVCAEGLKKKAITLEFSSEPPKYEASMQQICAQGQRDKTKFSAETLKGQATFSKFSAEALKDEATVPEFFSEAVKNKAAMPEFSAEDVKDETTMPNKCGIDVHYKAAMPELSAEVLQHIFKFVPNRQRVLCRQVNKWWKDNIDDMLTKDEVWEIMCKEDFRNHYKQAQMKSDPNMTWRQLYRSLCLWQKLKFKNEVWRNLTLNNVISVHSWKGYAAVHHQKEIMYYDTDSFTRLDIINTGNYYTFEENEDMIIYMLYTDGLPPVHLRRNLNIVPKINGIPRFRKMLVITNVFNYIVIDDDIYYNTKPFTRRGDTMTEVYVCKIKENFRCFLINTLPCSVWAYGYDGKKLHFLTLFAHIYTLEQNGMEWTGTFSKKDSFDTLCKYNFLEGALYDKLFHILRVMDVTSLKSLEDTTIRIYGDVVLVGNAEGKLKMYNRQAFYSDMDTKPEKEYDVKNMFQLSESKINGIDVIWRENGVNFIITTPNKLLVLCNTY